jgi:hypothetical protein
MQRGKNAAAPFLQLPIKFLISMRGKMLPLEKRILRDTPELAAQLAGSPRCATKYETQAARYPYPFYQA